MRFAPMMQVRPSGAADARGFLDFTLAPSVGAPAQSGTSPWVVLATIAGLSTAAIALARYLDDRNSRR